MAGGSLTTRRGFGAVYLPTYTDKRTGELRQSSIWWIQYSVHGQRKIENSHSRNRSDALKLLKKRLGEIVDGRLIVSTVGRTRFQDLADLLIDDYVINGRRSIVRAKRSVNHLRDFFGLARAIEITADRVSVPLLPSASGKGPRTPASIGSSQRSSACSASASASAR